MQKILNIMGMALLLALNSTKAGAQMPQMGQPLNAQKVSSGTLRVVSDFPSNHIRTRDVAIWTPANYRKGQPVDVLYMHDGQNLFDSLSTWNRQEWQMDETIERLMQKQQIRPTIVVGIANIPDDRLTDYFPQKTRNYFTPTDRQMLDSTRLKADAYLRFIVEELKPFVDREYQPLTSPEHTYIMGSSMGGLISLYALCEYPQVFGGAGCLSTHVPMVIVPELFNDKEAIDRWAAAFRTYLEQHLPQANSRLVYMDRGTASLDAYYGTYQALIDQLFEQAGWDAQHFQTKVFEGHQHMENDWARRLEQPLTFLLAPKE